MKQIVQLFLVCIFLIGCQRKEATKRYSINDFPPELRKTLEYIVNKGMVSYDSLTGLSNANLVKLTRSEHPILRCKAFREIFSREMPNSFDLMMNHLDDTAIVLVDHGHYGLNLELVSDFILDNAIWKTEKERTKTVDKVLTQHNYLLSAYKKAGAMEAEQKYYPFIKKMVMEGWVNRSDSGIGRVYADVEPALFALAKFKVRDDIVVISKKLSENIPDLGTTSFQLMEDFPEPDYLSVLEEFHKRKFYRLIGSGPGGFTGVAHDRLNVGEFFNAVAAQKSPESAIILDTLLNRLQRQMKIADKSYALDELARSISKYPCPAFDLLQKKVQKRLDHIEAMTFTIDPSEFPQPVDTTPVKIRWDYP